MNFTLKNYPYRYSLPLQSRYSSVFTLKEESFSEIVQWLCDNVGKTYIKSQTLYKMMKMYHLGQYITYYENESTWHMKFISSRGEKKWMIYFKDEKDYFHFSLKWA